MKQIINIGIIGFGTVGSGVYNIIKNNLAMITLRSGTELKIKTICDLNIDKLKKEIEGITISERWEDVVDDPDIDIVVELIGGISPAREIIIKSLKKGKNVVTANKKLLAEWGSEIMEVLAGTGNSLGFEAAVGGGIPCILALKKGLVGNYIKSILGILNGTTNYILTKMEDEGIPFDLALKDAQERGFAETDPTLDVEGIDAGHKIALLAMLSYGESIDFEAIPIEGISNISPLDIAYARDMGYVIKLLGIAKYIEGSLDIRVHPTMIPRNHPLASVRNEFNSVMFDGDMTDAVILNGKGAGSLPTASAVVSDIVQLSNKNIYPGKITGKARIMPSDERVSRYYLRLHTEDCPGILSQISGILGEGDISIASVIQKEITEKFVPLMIVTHEASEKNILNCIRQIEKFEFVKDRVTCIRVEDFNWEKIDGEL